MPQRGQGPLRAALDRAVLLYRRGNVAEALTGLRRARTGVPHDGSGLPSDEAAALAASWELQAAADLCAGELEAGLEGLAIAEQVLDGRPEHNELRGRLCARIAWQVPDSFAGLRSVRAEYLASARHLLAGSPEYRELPDAPPKDWGRA